MKFRINSNFIELRNVTDPIEPRAILTNIISVFPSAKHVPHFATRKTANYISKQLRKAVQASFARTGGSSLASESCTIRKSWKKTQLHCTIALDDGSGAVHFLRQISAMMGPARFIFASIMSAFTAKNIYC